MEIVIDFIRVRTLIAQEYRQASGEIAALGPQRAYENSRSRHDERLASSPDASTLACSAGCSWCCNFTVDVRAVEVLSILQFMDEHLTPAQRSRAQSEIDANQKLMAPLDDVERMQTNVKCPFLEAGRCIIYAARPQTCRNYHATDAKGCQQSFEQPDNLDIDPEFAPLTYQLGGAHVEAFSKAMHDAGYDAGVYEMNSALALAIHAPGLARQRFESRLPLFATLQGDEVPTEFADDENEGADEE